MSPLIMNFISSGSILFLLLSNTSNAQHLQRFFTTPEQRSFLNSGNTTVPLIQSIQTKENQDIPFLANPTSIEAINPYTAIIITFNGLVIREGNQHTVWLNEHPFSIDQLPPSIRIDQKRNQLIQFFDTGKSKNIDIGQQFSIFSPNYIKKYSIFFSPPSTTAENISDPSLENNVEHYDKQSNPSSVLNDIQNANKSTENLLEQL